jgi:chromosome partitioning protein
MAKTISVAASKGGTGKTTTSWNLAFGLSLAGARVCLVDCDPQDNLRFIAGVDPTPGTVAAAIEGWEVEPVQLREEVWLLPGGGRKLFHALQSADGLRTISGPLRRTINRLDDSFDFMIFDCPPEFGRITQAALSNSDYLLVPCISTWLGLRSIEQMIEFIDAHPREGRIDAERLSVIMTFYTTRRAGPELVRQEAKKMLRQRLFRTVIRERTELDYSQETHQSIFEYSPHSDGAADYSSLTKELIKRLG